jgi:DNA-binding XRE family transcriptional regulator
MRSHPMPVGRHWKLRRIYAGLRQQDVASNVGISTTRYSAIERAEAEPTDLEKELIERALPGLPDLLSSAVQSQNVTEKG